VPGIANIAIERTRTKSWKHHLATRDGQGTSSTPGNTDEENVFEILLPNQAEPARREKGSSCGFRLRRLYKKANHRQGGGISRSKLTKVLDLFNSALPSQLGFWRNVITVARKESYLLFGRSMLTIVLLRELRKSYVKSVQKLHSRPLAGRLGRSHHSHLHERAVTKLMSLLEY